MNISLKEFSGGLDGVGLIGGTEKEDKNIKAGSVLAVLAGKLFMGYQASWDCGNQVWGACTWGLSIRTEMST